MCSSLRPSVCASTLSSRRLTESNNDNVERGCMYLCNLQTDNCLSGSSWLAGSTFYVHHAHINSLYKSIISRYEYLCLFVVFLDCSNELPSIGATHIRESSALNRAGARFLQELQCMEVCLSVSTDCTYTWQWVQGQGQGDR